MASSRLKVERAAMMYLDMRGFNILELNWGLSKSKIDIVAEKHGKISFIEISQRDDSAELPLFTKSKADKLKMAGEAWADQNKYLGKYIFSSIEISKPGLAIIGFNEDILL
jgi:Holliday junction resolvase-like predicted endonuclease